MNTVSQDFQNHDPYSGTASPLSDFIKAVQGFNSTANDDKSVAKLQKASKVAIQKIEENE